ncbi:MAG TPA: ComEC/Rec2 family competence protein [Candidatus Paceibacterota bacterium]|nr:ComEC/Rec2 family competence protein [Candidatus Paceibacterota bacterium]
MERKLVISLFVFVYLCALVVRTDFFLRAEANETLKNYIGTKAAIEGVVANDPEKRATSLHANIRLSAINGAEASGTLLATFPREAELSYGDRVTIAGKIEAPETFETDTGRIFDYPNYLRVQGISATLAYGTIEHIERGGWSLQKTLFTIKHAFERSLERLFPEPDNSLLEGVLLGERRGLPDELNRAFIVSSLVHVVVLSGYNISIVANAMLYATSWLPRTMSYGLGGVLMILFAIMTGAGATTVRACIMGLIAILAQYMRRSAVAMRSLIVAAGAMVLWNPLIAFHDTSFILSMLATFGLITLSPAVEKYLRWIPQWKYFDVRAIAASTIAVQMYILPALLYYMGVLSFVALPANLLALPVVPFAMLFGFLAGLVGLAAPFLGLPIALLADALLRWMIFVADTAASLPFSSAVIAAFPAWVMFAAYVPLTALGIYCYRKEVTAQRLRRSVSR